MNQIGLKIKDEYFSNTLLNIHRQSAYIFKNYLSNIGDWGNYFDWGVLKMLKDKLWDEEENDCYQFMVTSYAKKAKVPTIDQFLN